MLIVLSLMRVGQSQRGTARGSKLVSPPDGVYAIKAELAICQRRNLAFPHLVTGQIAQTLIRRVLVGLAQRGIVENLLDKLVDGSVVVENHHSDVNQFGSALADNAHSEQLLVGAREHQFQHS